MIKHYGFLIVDFEFFQILKSVYGNFTNLLLYWFKRNFL